MWGRNDKTNANVIDDKIQVYLKPLLLKDYIIQNHIS